LAFVSIFTVGRLEYPYEHPVSRDFYEIGYKVMRQANGTGNLVMEFSPNEAPPFPEHLYKGEGYPILTLTVWKNLQTLYRFTYSGRHKQAIQNRIEWIEPYPEKQPTYVLWWTEKIKDVSWEEAYRRYKYYIQHGPSSFAFDYKAAFDKDGQTFLLK
jgi:hypothetical protein